MKENKLGKIVRAYSPSYGDTETGDSWDLQARQLSLLDNLCANEKPCLYLFICSFLKGFICASESFA